MKTRILLMSVLVALATTLSAQTTREQADIIVKNYLQNEMIETDSLYVNLNEPSEDGITIMTFNDELFTAKYACWAYFLHESNFSRCRYLFVKEDNGNLLEVIANNDFGQQDATQWALVKIALSSISISPKEITIEEDQNVLLTVDFDPIDAENQNVTWESRNISIATVDLDGMVTGISEGETYVVVTSEDGGYQDSCKVTVDAVNSVTIWHVASLQVYPNPTTGQLIISLSNSEGAAYEVETIEMYDIYGKLVYNSQLSNINYPFNVDVSHLANGIYTMKIYDTNKQVSVVKVIKN